MKKIITAFLIGLFVLSSPVFAGIGEGRKTVATATTAEALAATTPYNTVTICAETDNTGVMTVGSSAVVGALATRTGIPLAAGVCTTLSNTLNGGRNLKDIYLDTTVNGDGVTYFYTKD